jgi:hypothetical protein
MSDQESQVEEAREVIKVRRISAKPNAPEKKNEEAEAAKARQAELEKRLRRQQFLLVGAALAFLLLGLRVLGGFTLERSPKSASSPPPTNASPSAPLPSRPRFNDVVSPNFRRLFTSEPGVPQRATGAAPTLFAPGFADGPLSPSNAAPRFTPSLDDLRVVRIAVWNLEPFNFSKVNDANVGEKIARLLQEFDVVAVQGVRSKNRAVLEALVYLIARQGGEYDYVASSPASLDSISAFFFNAQTVVVDRESVSDVFDARGRLSTPALVANFRLNAVAAESGFTFQIINAQFLGADADGETLADLLATLKKRAGGFGIAEDDLIVAGDFGVPIQKIKGVEKIPNVAALHQDQTTDVDGGGGVNLLFDSVATVEYVERFGVVDLAEYFDISNAEAKKIARGRPVWGDFSVYEGGDPHFFTSSEKK